MTLQDTLQEIPSYQKHLPIVTGDLLVYHNNPQDSTTIQKQIEQELGKPIQIVQKSIKTRDSVANYMSRFRYGRK
jgi:hypothetical protein